MAQAKSPPSSVRVHLHLSQASYCPGDAVVGCVTLQSLPGAAPLVLDAVALRLHGHARVDPRWISLPQAIRRLYNQDGKLDAHRVSASATPGPRAPGQPPSPFLGPKRGGYYGYAELLGFGGAGPDGDGAPTREGLLDLVPTYPELVGEHTACIFTTPAVLLLAAEASSKALELGGGEARQFLFTSTLPESMMPSFKGLGCRFFYHASVSLYYAPGAPSPTRHLHFPFQVLSAGLPSSSNIKYVTTSTISVQPVAFDPQPSLEPTGTPHAGPDACLHARTSLLRPSATFRGYNLDNAFVNHPAARGLPGLRRLEHEGPRPRTRELTSFRIRHGTDHICTVTLSRTQWYPGDAVAVRLDFANAHLPCSSVAVGLDLEEHTALATGGARRVHGTRVQSQLAYTLRSRQAQVILHLPCDAPTTFHTPLVRTDWTLRFAFSIFVPRTPEVRGAWEALHAPPQPNVVPPAFRVGPFADEVLLDLKLEVLEWETPLRVLGSRNAGPPVPSLKAGGSGEGEPGNPRSELEALAQHAGIPVAVLEAEDVVHQDRRLRNNPTLAEDLAELRRRPSPKDQVRCPVSPPRRLAASMRSTGDGSTDDLGLGVAEQRQVLAGLEVQRSYCV